MHYISDLGDMQTDYRPSYTLQIPWTLPCVSTCTHRVLSEHRQTVDSPIQIHFILKADMEL
jgi:hypothetical protein